MRFLNVLRELNHRPWLLDSASYATLQQVVNDRVFSSDSSRADSDLDDFITPRPEAVYDPVTGIATIHLVGVCGKRLSAVEKTCGNTDYDDIIAEIDAMQAAGAEAFIFRIASGGGMVLGLSELVERVRQLRVDGYATVAFTDYYACSAMYWFAVACDAIIATPSAQVASIGVIIPWVDSSKALEEAGLHPRPITNREADLKGIGYAGSLTPEQEQHLQEEAQKTFGAFRAAVLTNRKVPASAMRGQCIGAAEGIFLELVDELGDLQTAMERAIEIAALKSIDRDRI